LEDIRKPALTDSGFKIFRFAQGPTLLNVLLIALAASTVAPLLFFHPMRWVLVRRFFAIQGTLYLIRCCTLTLTILPDPNKACVSEAIAGTPEEVLWFEAWRVAIGARVTCGDMTFSGHTSMITDAVLFLHTYLDGFLGEYRPLRLNILFWGWALGIGSVIAVIETRIHYSIDVVLAIAVTIAVFKGYHYAVSSRSRLKSFKILEWYENVTP
jgi:PAP2 superfamily C-terminal